MKSYKKIGKEEFEKIRNNVSTENDLKKVVNDENTLEKLSKTGVLKKLAEDLKTMMSMVKDYVSGKYKGVPFGTILAIAGSIAYVVCPVDAIPDVIPILGQLDDATVVTLCLQLARVDLATYKSWKQKTSKQEA